MKRALLLLAALLSLAACGGAEDAAPTPEAPAGTPAPETATPSPTPTPTPRAAPPAPCSGPEPPLAAAPEPPLAAAPDWPHPNYDARGSRATFTSAITSENVKSLEVAWRYELPSGGAFGIVATTPIVSGGVVYLGDLQTNVHAIDLESGNRRWMVDVEQWTYGPSGVAVSGGCVFANLGGHSIAAYRAIDGERLWSTYLLGNGGAVNFQPLVAGGTVFAATSSLSQPGARGTLYALDPSTGEVRWSFNTILSEDVWGNPEINSGGGAWTHPPSTSMPASLTGAPPTPIPTPASRATPSARAAPATTAGPTPSLPSTSPPASSAGASSTSPTTSSTVTPSSPASPPSTMAPRSSSAPASSAASSASIATALSSGRRPSASTRTTTLPSSRARSRSCPATLAAS